VTCILILWLRYLERALSMALAINCSSFMPKGSDYGGARRILGRGPTEGTPYHHHFTSGRLTISHRLSLALTAPILEISDPHDRNSEHDNTIDVLAFSASGALQASTTTSTFTQGLRKPSGNVCIVVAGWCRCRTVREKEGARKRLRHALRRLFASEPLMN
jgi:hypothetical protein